MDAAYYRRLRYCLILILSLGGSIIRAIILTEFEWPWHILAFVVQFIDMVLIWESMRILNKYLNRKLPFEGNVNKRIFIQGGIIIFLAVVLVIPMIILVDRFAPFPIILPFKIVVFMAGFLMILTLNLGYVGAHLFDQWKNSLLHSIELEKEKSTVQYQNLINQLNPHFFFNSLTSLNSLIHKDQHLASEFLQQLSKVYRYMLDNKTKELVTLRAEVSFLENYIQLLKTRFGKGIEVNINLTNEADTKLIVPVSLQIMIENAVKHNIIVENNLQRKINIEDSNKLGLENFKTLYIYLSSDIVEIIEGDIIHSKLKFHCYDHRHYRR
jgi:two-component system LytT family sensor kinase